MLETQQCISLSVPYFSDPNSAMPIFADSIATEECPMSKTTTPNFSHLLAMSMLLTISVSSCSTASKTSSGAPDSTAPSTQASPAVNADDKGDAQNPIRKKQIESDIRAREQRNNIGGDSQARNAEDLASEVRGKLEANIPSSKLSVEAKDATVTISGTVAKQDQLAKIQPLAMQIKGVKSAIVKATVKP
jgi:hyperosmotically inducible periplasmic protein